MKTCNNFVCQVAVTSAYLLKEIDDEGVANHPCRDIVKVMQGKPHINVGVIGGRKMNQTLIVTGLSSAALALSALEMEETKLQETFELTCLPPSPIAFIPKRDDGANTFRHHGKNSYRKFGGRK
jgi:hypothetical protein